MKKWCVILTFITTMFSANTVAGSVEHKSEKTSNQKVRQPMQYPESCLEEHIFPCAVMTESYSYELVGPQKVTLGPKVTAVLMGTYRISLAKGSVWVKNYDKYLVVTPSGKVVSQLGNESFLVTAEDEGVEVNAIQGLVAVQPNMLGEVKSFGIPAGYRVHMDSSKGAGFKSLEIPLSINMKNLIRIWAPMYRGSSEQMVSELSGLRESWEKAAHEGSDLLVKVVQREIATAQAAKKRTRQRQERLRREKAELRKLFEEKNYVY